MKLRVGRRAQKQADRIDDWWVAHRPAAPALFTDELEQTFQHICERPGAGVPWPTARRPTLRRILMPRTGNHVYFAIDEKADVVHVLSIWGGPRTTTPKL